MSQQSRFTATIDTAAITAATLVQELHPGQASQALPALKKSKDPWRGPTMRMHGLVLKFRGIVEELETMTQTEVIAWLQQENIIELLHEANGLVSDLQTLGCYARLNPYAHQMFDLLERYLATMRSALVIIKQQQ